MIKNNEDLDKMLEKVKEYLLDSNKAIVKIEKGSNGRIFTEITPTEKIIIKI